MKRLIINEIQNSINVKNEILNNNEIISQIENLVNHCINSLKSGGKIIFCGNGGSFADSQHLTAELISRLRFDREPLPAIALGTNSSNMSAIANDYGYEQVFKREIIALANENDVFIPISTSGNSKNVIHAIKEANKKNIKTVALTGFSGGKIKELCDSIVIPSDIVEKIQEVHIMIGHILCFLIEEKLFKN
jgi:D-sedoheptulose 7-phosphate isomerase